MRRVRAEIGDGHFAAGHKSGNGGEQSQSDQHAPAELDDAGDEHQGIVEFARAAQNAKKLLGAMTRVQESRYEAHQAVNLIGIPVQDSHQILAFLVIVSAFLSSDHCNARLPRKRAAEPSSSSM